MITCPEFDTNIHNLRFNLMFDALAVFSIIIHFYCIYCILYRSPAQMKTYHWYLLWHQVASFFGDIFINAIAKPIVFIPLPLGYLNGLGAGFVHPKVALGAGQFFVTLACVTSLHLFIYRYLCVSGNSQGNGVRFPLWSKILLGYNYMIPVVNFVCTATANDHTEQVLAEWAKEYSCVTPSLMSIPHIWAYNKMECMWRTVLVCWCDMINMAIGVPYFVRVTFKAIDVKVMSENTRRMQRNFLIQLMLQASVPMIFVMLPALIFAPTVMFDIFGIPYINDVVFICFSLFGVSGGLVLIAVIPSYHWWWRKPTPVIAVASTTQNSAYTQNLSQH